MVMMHSCGFRCLFWQDDSAQMEGGVAVRLSCTAVGDNVKADKLKKGNTKKHTSNQTECVKNGASEKKLTKSKRKNEEVTDEKTKHTVTNSKAEGKRPCKGLGKDGQTESTGKQKEQRQKSSDCQSPSNNDLPKDTVSQFY